MDIVTTIKILFYLDSKQLLELHFGKTFSVKFFQTLHNMWPSLKMKKIKSNSLNTEF